MLLSAQWGGPSGIEAQSLGPLFLQCFDTVGWVFRPIKPVPEMTYNVYNYNYKCRVAVDVRSGEARGLCALLAGRRQLDEDDTQLQRAAASSSIHHPVRAVPVDSARARVPARRQILLH